MTPNKAVTISDTSNNTGLHAFAVQIVADAVFTAWDGMTGFSGITYPAGQIFFGPFTRVQLASGKVVIYSAE